MIHPDKNYINWHCNMHCIKIKNFCFRCWPDIRLFFERAD
ncbi:hypothetical protein SALWKB2_0781 [Snodgrassella alvi wkB2]|nr:hypothetical protein SALWKB2_0781 [Snodgrassella alvi wkB2]